MKFLNKKLLTLQFLFTAGFFIPAQSEAAYYYQFNVTCQKAYYKFLALQLVEGRALLQQEKTAHPENLIPVYLENYADFFLLTCNEKQSEYDALIPNKEKRLTLLEQGDKSSPWYNYCLAEVNLQWAMVQVKFESFLSAVMCIKKGYSLLTENQESFPAFTANKKSLGVLHCMIGTVPDSYKWAASLLGFKGTIAQGIGELEDVMTYSKSNSFLFHDESMMFYIFMLMHLKNEKEKAWNLTEQSDFPIENNLLSVFVKSDVAIKTGRTDVAIDLLKTRPSATGFTFHFLDYLLGISKLDRLDEDANVYLEKFIKEFEGRNYLKDAIQKLAWYKFIHGDYDGYFSTLKLCETKGHDFVDSDKQAQKEFENHQTPNLLLLKARLLTDGGYYFNAISMLQGKSTKDFAEQRDKIEFTYRAGRIYHEWGKPDEAIGFYIATIKNGEGYPYYFAANAALELGLIYEKKNDKAQAKIYFQKALDMPKSDYATGINQQAKAGLNRIGS